MFVVLSYKALELEPDPNPSEANSQKGHTTLGFSAFVEKLAINSLHLHDEPNREKF
jgi:hypothetical protein